MDDKIKKIGETLCNKYNNCKNVIVDSPKELCLRLEKSAKFKSVSKDVQKKLGEILTKKIEKIEENTKLSLKIAKFTKLKRNLKYIPDGVASHYGDKISDKLDEINEKVKNLKDDVNSAIEVKRDDEILDHIAKLKEGHVPTEIIFPIRNYISQNSSAYLEEAKKNINDKEDFSLVRKFQEFHDKFSLPEFNGEVKSHARELETLFQRKVNDYLYSASIKFKRKNPKKKDSDAGSEKSMAKITTMIFGDETLDKEEKAVRLIFEQLLSLNTATYKLLYPKFQEKLYLILQEFLENMVNVEKNFNASIDDNYILKFEQLRESLYNMKQWEFFFNKEYADVLNLKLNLRIGLTLTASSNNLEVEENLRKKFENLFSGFKKIKKFDEAMNIVKDRVIRACTFIKNTDFQKQYKNAEERTNNFKTLYEYLKSISEFTTEDNISIFCSVKECQELFKMSNNSYEYVKKAHDEIVLKIKELLDKDRLLKDEACQTLNNLHINLESFLKYSQDLNIVDPKEKNNLESELERHLENLYSEARSNLDRLQEFAKALIKIKRIEINVRWRRSAIYKSINDLLTDFKGKNEFVDLGRLGTSLNSSPIGKVIIQEHPIFEGYNTAKFNRKVQTHKIEQVIRALEGTNLDSKKLRDRYDEFEKIYKDNLDEYLKPEMNLNNLVENIISTASNAKIQKSKDTGKHQWTTKQTNDLPKILAMVFNLWTLSNATNYFASKEEKKEGDGDKDYLLLPLPAQVITIFRLLGVGDERELLSNNLIQVLTGEGKSVILGISSTMLSLYGFEVYCACYSNHLCERDFKSFLPLFQMLKVDPFIKYGTFNLLSERIINEAGDIRKLAETLIKPDPEFNKPIENKESKPKLLLVDEVDVFFSPDFYGNVYSPAAVIRDDTITALIQYIWNQRKDPNLHFHNISKSSEYKFCRDLFKEHCYILDEAIKEMVRDVKIFDTPHYECKNGKIGYREHDDLTFNVIYGYKTLFAYYHEHSEGKINSETLKNNSYIRINVGYFSYAEIPLKFEYILGVTGTLKTLSPAEKKVVQEKYLIKKETYCPSVFGQTKLNFRPADDIFIESTEDEFYMKIASEIKKGLERRGPERALENRGAVLVFFENEEKLKNFLNSKKLDMNINEIVKTLTEKDDAENKFTKIKTASNKGNVTLLTRVFGRGVDFISFDDDVSNSGGVQVIQTFLSEQESEEVQIRGRTARQGQEGSYCMVLHGPSLERFSSTLEKDLKSCSRSEIYKLLNKARNAYFDDIYESKRKFIKETEEEHKLTEKFYDSVKKGDVEAIKRYILSKNIAPADSIRIIALLDGTGSMGRLLEKCKNNIRVMFERARTVLLENKCDPNCFQMQLCIYRDYDCGTDEILKVSNWETIPERLREFMVKINAQGGGDYEEAVEIALQHAYKEHNQIPVSRVILIADAPAKSLDQVKEYRNNYAGGEEKWLKLFGEATYYKKELEKFVSHDPQLSVNTFFIQKDECEENFREIAELTKGEATFLPIDEPDGEQTLVNFITEEILAGVGKVKGNADQLINAYRTKYPNHL